mgnify:CR=1 FL=1
MNKYIILIKVLRISGRAFSREVPESAVVDNGTNYRKDATFRWFITKRVPGKMRLWWMIVGLLKY